MKKGAERIKNQYREVVMTKKMTLISIKNRDVTVKTHRKNDWGIILSGFYHGNCSSLISATFNPKQGNCIILMTPPSLVWSSPVSTSNIAQWLIAEVPDGGHIGFDPFLFSLRESLLVQLTSHSPGLHQIIRLVKHMKIKTDALHQTPMLTD